MRSGKCSAFPLAIVVILVLAGIAVGGQIIARQVVSGLLLGSIYMTVAVAFTLTIGVLNFLNFTIPSLFMLTGMVAWGLLANGYVSFAGGWGWLVALAAGVAVAVAASLLVERFTFRYLKMKHGDAIEHAIPLVSSLGFLIIFEHLVLITLGSESQRFAVPFKADVHLANLVLGVPQLASCALAVAVVAALSLTLKRTKSAGRCEPSPKIPIRPRCSVLRPTRSCRLSSSLPDFWRASPARCSP